MILNPLKYKAECVIVGGEERIKLTFPMNDYRVITAVATIPGRRYFPNTTYNDIYISLEILKSIVDIGFNLDAKLSEKLLNEEKTVSVHNGIEIHGLKKELFPYQKEAVTFIDQRNGSALMGHQMGLGKSIITLAWLQKHPEHRPAVIVVPASLKLNWKREAESWMSDPKIELLSGTKTYPLSGEIIILNYDILHDWSQEIRRIKPKVLILDEIHAIKNNKAKRTKATKMLARSIPYRIGLTGTLILNRPAECFNGVNIVNQNIFRNQMQFYRRYCGMHHNGFGWVYNGASNIKELHDILTGTILLRVLKKDVLKDLPEKTYSFVPIELSNEKEYREAERDFVAWIKKEKGTEAVLKTKSAVALATIEGLKQLCIKGKMEQCIDWIEQFIENEKLVVFCSHHSTVDALMQRFGKIAVKHDGRCSEKEKQKAVDDFQGRDEIKLFVGNLISASQGITLTASSNVAFVEYPWSPGILNQAVDRTHRIGQRFNVGVYYLLSSNTIEEKIAKMLDKKRMVLDGVLDGVEPEQGTLLTELMKEYEQLNFKK